MLKNCCFCIDLKNGGILIGIADALCGLVTFCTAVFALNKSDMWTLDQEKWLIRVAFFGLVLILGIFTVATSILLVIGILQKKAKFLLVWLAFTVFSTFVYMIYSLCRSFNPINMVLDASSIGLDIYFCYVVHSLYEELKLYDENPEAQVLFRRTESSV